MQTAAASQAAGTARLDPALRPYVLASGDEAERCLETLLAGDTERTIRAIVARTLFGPARAPRGEALDVEDVRADVIVHLLDRLRRVKSDPGTTTIENFSAYVATIAYRTCYTHLRRLYPQRARLKNRLRYTLACDPDLSLEQDDAGIWRCGLTAWLSKEGERRDVSPRPIDRFRREPSAYARELVDASRTRPVGVADNVKALLDAIGEPVDLDLLVDGVSGLLGVDTRAHLSTSPLGEESARVADSSASVVRTLAQREYLGALWDEVRELPANQRTAILLNLRDDDGAAALPLLPMLGVATIRTIAGVLDMPALELAGLWPKLPMDDAWIAARLGLTRQQVINLRKSGRQRLGRRMAKYGATQGTDW